MWYNDKNKKKKVIINFEININLMNIINLAVILKII